MQRSSYVLGIAYCLAAFFISALNDVISKKAGLHLGGINVLFFRFFFSALTFLPLILFKPHLFATRHMKTHIMRGGLFALAMLPWSYGLIALPLPLVTTIGFTTPLFVILLAKLFLKESVGWPRAVATLLGFLGIIVSVGFSLSGLNIWVGLALLATFLFASLDIINKRLLTSDEGLIPLTFFSALWTTIFTAPLAAIQWISPSWTEVGFLFILGCGANLFLALLLKAFSSCEISALQPLRYTEFIFSCALSFLVFKEMPSLNVLLGICFIVPATLYLSYHESSKSAKLKKLELAEPPI